MNKLPPQEDIQRLLNIVRDIGVLLSPQVKTGIRRAAGKNMLNEFNRLNIESIIPFDNTKKRKIDTFLKDGSLGTPIENPLLISAKKRSNCCNAQMWEKYDQYVCDVCGQKCKLSAGSKRNNKRI